MQAGYGRICPHCNAQNTLVVDYHKGQVTCTECASVAEMALTEDENTRFDDTGAVMNMELDGGPQTTSSGSFSGPRNADENARNRGHRVISLLQTRIGFIPDGVAELAKDYFDRYCRFVQERQTGRVNHAALACACFLLAAPQLHLPIPANELFAIDVVKRQVSQSLVSQLRQSVITNLNLRSVMETTQHWLWMDFSLMIHQRMEKRTVGHCAEKFAAAMGAHFEDEVCSGKSVSAIMGTMIVLTYCHKDATQFLFKPSASSVSESRAEEDDILGRFSNRGTLGSSPVATGKEKEEQFQRVAYPFGDIIVNDLTSGRIFDAVGAALKDPGAKDTMRGLLTQTITAPKAAALIRHGKAAVQATSTPETALTTSTTATRGKETRSEKKRERED